MSSESAKWLYENLEGVLCGPVSSVEIKVLFEKGQLDGVTKVKNASNTDSVACSLGEIAELRALIASTEDEDDEANDSSEADADLVGHQSSQSASAPDGSHGATEQSSVAMWFYAEVGGAQSGPVAAEAFASLVAAGYVSSSTLVWCAGMPAWAPIASTPALAHVCQPAPQTQLEDKAGQKRDRSGEEARPRKRGKGHSKRGGPSTWVYVTGLPPDVTAQELEQHMRKTGLVKVDPDTGGPRVKIYCEEGSAPCKGDASVCYVMPESVALAVEILDGSCLRGQQWPLHVEVATFSSEGGGTQAAKAASASAAAAATAAAAAGSGSLTTAQRIARIKAMEQAVKLSWADEGDEAAPLPHAGMLGSAGGNRGGKAVSMSDMKIVVLKNMFDPGEVSQYPATVGPGGRDAFIAELREDIATELEASCGPLEKLTVFTRHPEGVLVAKFVHPGAASRCLNQLNGRFYGGRTVEVHFWDGVTDYSHKTDEKEEQERIDEFGKWLEEGEGGSEDSGDA